VAGLATAFGSGAMTNSINEIEEAQTILVIGSNTTETHPVIGYRVRRAKRNGAALIVADPRKINLAESADLFLQLKPGTNVALLNGLAHVIIKEGLQDDTFIKDRTENYEGFKRVVEKYTPAYVEKITGVPVADIEKAALLYAESQKSMILYTMGITQHSSGVDNVLAVANLAMLTGNIGKPSSGVNPLRGQNNVQGACDMGALPNVFTGYQRVDDPQINRVFSEKWGLPLSDKPGLTVTEIFDASYEGKIKALYVMGENPVVSDADTKHVLHALKKLDFLVVQDLFLTDTARLADVVLPAASFAEKKGTFVNTERRVQLIRPAVPSPGEALEDWIIIQKLAQKLGFAWSYRDSSEIMEEIAELTPSYHGINYERLEKGGLQWPCPDSSHPGTPYLHAGQFARGAGLFKGVEYKPPAEEPDNEFPFIMTTGRHLYHYHTGTMSRHSLLEEFRPEEKVQLNPQDAEVIGVSDGDKVAVTSRRGSVQCKVHVTDIVPPGVLFMTFHYSEVRANLLTNNTLDPIAKIPEFKVSAVKVEKI
jgi:formate dehydrogenase alpha subunit